MGFLDKAKAAIADPENRRKAQEFAQKQLDKKKHGHGSHHGTRRHGAGIFADHEEEFDEGDE